MITFHTALRVCNEEEEAEAEKAEEETCFDEQFPLGEFRYRWYETWYAGSLHLFAS